MTALNLFNSYWELNIPALAIAAGLIIFHYISNGKTFNKKSFLFFSGVLLYLFATVSALSYLGDYYLFSAHMIKHIIILLVVPPMLLSSTNPDYLKKIVGKPGFQKIGKIIFNPILAWTLGVGSMWLWHIPALFELLESSPILKLVQMISILVFGLIFIYPVFSPVYYRKLQPLQSALYLFTACVGCTVLGIFITFAPAGLYAPYVNGTACWCCVTSGVPGSFAAGNNPAILSFLENNWGISSSIDQQVGGLIMWIPACFIYLANIMISISKWYQLSDKELVVENKIALNKLDLS
jgi:putative membrane protein